MHDPAGDATARSLAEGEVARSAPVRGAPLHIPSLDGLRAVSFLIVFAAHAGLDWIVPGGFGVTVFFFLSGFLITTLMRLEYDRSGTVSLRGFYLRRALRILPPFYLVLLLADLSTLLRLTPVVLEPGPVIAQLLHYSNYWFASHGYRGAALGTVVYWSLAVEEHFYLAFPLAYLLLRRLRLSSRVQGVVLWSICALVCAWRCWLVLRVGVPTDRTYLASDTRIDSILFGCALAVAMNPVLDPPLGRDRLWKSALLPAGIALLLASFLVRAPWFRETVRYSVQGIALTPLFVVAVRFPDWAPLRWLNAPRVAFVGALSYSLYLVHQVVLFAMSYRLPALHGALRGLLALLVSYVLALAIYRTVERPCARLRRRLAGA